MVKTDNNYWAFPVKWTHGLSSNFPITQTIMHYSDNEGSGYYWPHLTFSNGICDYHFNVSVASGNGASITDRSLFPTVKADSSGGAVSISNALAWKASSTTFNVIPIYDSTSKIQGAQYGSYDPYIHKVGSTVKWLGQAMNEWKPKNSVTSVPVFRFDKNKSLRSPLHWCVVGCKNCTPYMLTEKRYGSSSTTVPKVEIDLENSGVTDNWDFGDGGTTVTRSANNTIFFSNFSRRKIATDSSGYTWYMCCANAPSYTVDGSDYSFFHPICVTFLRTYGNACECIIPNFGMTLFKNWEF